eukprot:NODE_8630_length_660_cov_54.372439_g8005_i0.p1 GENE.NODE_8630_length_660_cov_54.372439_g8005_i0~~NODE_8630_length_660_cov_54.372439_g8005_i0.p1  ORF type:complete len:112 (+),score=23.44 NODE_8630_length_660_cov_54.372439_g8005_i0:57-392(+)
MAEYQKFEGQPPQQPGYQPPPGQPAYQPVPGQPVMYQQPPPQYYQQPPPQYYQQPPQQQSVQVSQNTVVQVGASHEVNHCCHFILFLLTGGVWLPIWILACLGVCCARPCG